MALPSYVVGCLDFEINDAVVEIIIDGVHVSAMSLRTAKIANACLSRVIREYEARRAKIIPFPSEAESGAH